MADWTPTSFEPLSSANEGNRPYNNPGNLRKPGSKSGFMQYPSPEAGRLALEQDLLAKGKRGPTTITAFLNAYSPQSENDTSALINNMSKRLGIGPNDKLDFTDVNVRKRVADAVQQQEYPTMPLPVAAPQAPVAEQGGSGRGTVNPPLVGQPQPQHNQPRSYGYRGTNSMGVNPEAIATGVQNIGRSATFGLTDYPAAAVRMGVKALTGKGGDKNTFDNALSDIRYTNQSLDTSHPVAATVGNVTGDVAQGVITGSVATKAVGLATKAAKAGKVATALSEIGGQAATQGALGATQEVVTNPDADAKSIAKAAVVAGGFGGAGAAAGEVAKGVVANVVKNRVKDYNKGLEAVQAEYNATRAANQAAEQAALDQKAIMNAPDAGPMPARQVASAPPEMKVDPMTENQYRLNRASYKAEPNPKQTFQEFLDQTPSATGALKQGIKETSIDMVKQSIPNLAAGAALGTGAYLLGDQNDPYRALYAAGAAGLGTWKSKALTRGLTDIALMHPGAANTANQLTTGLGNAVGQGAVPYANPQPEDTRSLLRRTIDEDITRALERQTQSWSPTTFEPQGASPSTAPATQEWMPSSFDPAP